MEERNTPFSYNNKKKNNNLIQLEQRYNPFYYDIEWRFIDFLQNIQPWYFVSSSGIIYSVLRNKFLKQMPIGKGYLRVSLYMIDGTKKDYLVHRLVLMAFKPIENPELYQGNHKNGIKTCNALFNLEWATQSENVIHAYKNGFYKQGEGHNFNTLFTQKEVHLICRGLQDNMSIEDICEKLLNREYTSKLRMSIKLIKDRKNWKSVSRYYNF